MPKVNERPVAKKVIYKEPAANMCVGDKAITVELAKKLLGWQEETEKLSLGEDYIPELLAIYGKKVRCTNNTTNRQLYTTSIAMLKAVILNGWWEFNAEPVIIGKHGSLLNGQHSLIALIMAAVEYEKDPERWHNLKAAPTIDKVVIFGVDESDRVVNTMDTCKPRSLNDVLYRSEFFKDLSNKDRKTVSRITNFAVMLLWERTGAKKDAHSSIRSHAESLDFIERHPKLLSAVRFIFASQGELASYISLGYAAALLYLAGSSATEDKDKYLADRNEKHLSWKNWKKACSFFEEFADNEESMKELREAFGTLLSSGNVGKDERCALVTKAWLAYSADAPITAESLDLEFEEETDKFGNVLGRTLLESPSLGGIDLGFYDDEGSEDDAVEVTEEEVEKAKQEIREERRAADGKRPKIQSPPPGEHQKLPAGWKEGDPVWIVEDNGGHWRGKIQSIVGKVAEVKVNQGFAGAGTIQKVKVSQLAKKQPKPE